MPINSMAWAASSTGLLLFAGSPVVEAPQVANFAAVPSVEQTIEMTLARSTSSPPLPTLPQSVSRLVALNIPLNHTTINHTTIDSPIPSLSSPIPSLSSPISSLSRSTSGSSPHQDSFAIKPFAAQSIQQGIWFNCPGSLQSVTQQRPGMFPVMSSGCPLAYASSSLQAQRLAQLLQDPPMDGRQIRPALEGNIPVLRLGNETLLQITPQMADQLEQHSHNLAVQWANNLRQALGAKPIALAEAQKQMYGLQETAEVALGAASWYGPYFHGRMTANGEIYDQYDLTAAHRDLPLGSFVKVTNRRNGHSVVVRINDRGPYLDEDHRIIDLSYQAAKVLATEEKGIAPIELVLLKTIPKSAKPLGQMIAQLP